MPRCEDGWNYGDDCMTLEEWRYTTGEDFPKTSEEENYEKTNR